MCGVSAAPAAAGNGSNCPGCTAPPVAGTNSGAVACGWNAAPAPSPAEGTPCFHSPPAAAAGIAKFGAAFGTSGRAPATGAPAAAADWWLNGQALPCTQPAPKKKRHSGGGKLRASRCKSARVNCLKFPAMAEPPFFQSLSECPLGAFRRKKALVKPSLFLLFSPFNFQPNRSRSNSSALCARSSAAAAANCASAQRPVQP